MEMAGGFRAHKHVQAAIRVMSSVLEAASDTPPLDEAAQPVGDFTLHSATRVQRWPSGNLHTSVESHVRWARRVLTFEIVAVRRLIRSCPTRLC
jgi:hypothetical protein